MLIFSEQLGLVWSSFSIDNCFNSGLDKILTVNRETYSIEASVASPIKYPDKNRIITRARRNITAIYQIFGNIDR